MLWSLKMLLQRGLVVLGECDAAVQPLLGIGAVDHDDGFVVLGDMGSRVDAVTAVPPLHALTLAEGGVDGLSLREPRDGVEDMRRSSERLAITPS